MLVTEKSDVHSILPLSLQNRIVLLLLLDVVFYSFIHKRLGFKSCLDSTLPLDILKEFDLFCLGGFFQTVLKAVLEVLLLFLLVSSFENVDVLNIAVKNLVHFGSWRLLKP